MTDAERDDELAAWEFRVEQERETFQIYEQRRQAVELQAMAITAAALTVAGLLILGHEDLSRLGDAPRWGIPLALAGLLWTMGGVTIARFVAWTTPRWRGGPRREPGAAELPSEKVWRTLERLRTADERIGPAELRRRAHAHWKARAESAYGLGAVKQKRLTLGLWGLVVPALYLGVVAGALVCRAIDAA